ncbi:MAG: AsmA family protein [Elusimicrobia bacterium]|nr:AsmA family protein [Elusimicrobiota bacterium]
MRKFLKFSAWALASALLLGLVSFAALKFYFTPERIKTLLTGYAEANLKRQISLDSAALNLRGFSIKNLRIAEHPDFGKREFFSAEEFSIRPDFRALLKKELKINSISASGLNVSIIEVKKNVYNFSDLMSPPQPPEGAKKPGAESAAKPPAFGISNISVKNSRLSYTSADKTLHVALDEIKLSASSIAGESLFPFEADFKLKLKSPYLSGDFPAYLKGKASLGALDPKKGKVRIEKALLTAGKINCELKGELENFLEPDASLDLRIKPFSSTDLKAFFPAVPARILLPAVNAAAGFKLTAGKIAFKSLDFKAGPVEGSLKGRLAWDPVFSYALNARVKAQVPEMNTDVLAKKFPAVPKGFHLPLTEIEADAALNPGKIKVKLAKLSAASLAATMTGKFALEPFSASGALKISAGDIHDLAQIVPALKPYKIKGKAGGGFNFTFDKILALRGKASFENVSAQFFDRKLSGLKGAVEIAKDRLSAEGVSGKLDGEDLKLGFSAKNYAAHPQVLLNLDLAALRLPAALPAESAGKAGAAKKRANAKPFYFNLEGKTRLGAISHPNLAAGETVIKYALKNISEDLKNLSGQASFEVNGGKFEKLYDLAKENKAAKVALYPILILGKSSKLAKGLKLPDFNTITFTKMEGDYAFKNGLMKIQKSVLISNVADASSAGSINLAADTLDLKISTTLKEASGIRMSVPVGMFVKGTFENPRVKLDAKSVMKQPAVKKNLKKAVKEGSKLLKKLLKK